MRILLQRTTHASVTVDGATVGEAGAGLLLLVGFGQGDDQSKLTPAASKVLNMRIFSDEQGRFNRSCLDVAGEILAVSQFTLYADTSQGRRPGFHLALEPDRASQLFDEFVAELRKQGASRVATGQFGAHMKVALENDGPVTIMVEM